MNFIKDKFTLYAAGVVLLIMLLSSALIYRNVKTKNDNYANFPEIIVSNQGVAARAKLSIQVKKEDIDWLAEHEETIQAQFRKEMSQMDLNSLRTTDGITAAQDDISKKLNQMLQTDKIEGVFFTELLVQEQN
jgi:flagellar basal body-associated protein FliL